MTVTECIVAVINHPCYNSALISAMLVVPNDFVG